MELFLILVALVGGFYAGWWSGRHILKNVLSDAQVELNKLKGSK